MLKEYFSMEISDSGHIVSIPLLLESFTPNLDRLPVFVLRLATEVQYSSYAYEDWEITLFVAG